MTRMLFNKKKKSFQYTTRQVQVIKDYEYLNTMASEGKGVLIGDTAAGLFPCEELFPFRVYNRSVIDDTTDKLLTRLDKNCLNIAPRSVILMIGASDIIFGRAPSAIVSNITRAVSALTADNNKRYIYVCSLPPLSSRASYASSIATVNDALQGQWTNDRYVKYVDVYAALTDDNGEAKSIFFASDGIPNIHGYAVMAKRLLEAMNYNPNPNNQNKK